MSINNIIKTLAKSFSNEGVPTEDAIRFLRTNGLSEEESCNLIDEIIYYSNFL